MKYSLKTIILLLCICFYASCSDDEEKTISRSDYKGRGSLACQDWQYALCDMMVNRCDNIVGINTIKECHWQFQTVACVDDAKASSCAQQVAEAS